MLELRHAIHGKIELDSIIDDYQENLKWHSMNKKFYYENGVTIYDDNSDFNEDVIVDKVNKIDVECKNLTYLEKIRLRIIFQYYNELARFDLNTEHISPLLKRLKKIEELDKVVEISDITSNKFIDIISLADVNTSMKKVLPLLICKQVYDKKKKERDNSKYLNIIIDEAHNILSFSSQRESETWKDYRLETFEEIIKELIEKVNHKYR